MVALFLAAFLSVAMVRAQSPGRCTGSAVPLTVASEGLAERLGDIVLDCSGLAAGTVFNGSFTVFLQVPVTNRVDAANVAREAVLAAGAFNSYPGLVAGQTITFTGVSFTVPSNGNVTLRIANVRAAVRLLAAFAPVAVTANISMTGSPGLLLDRPQFVVAYPVPAFAATVYSTGIACTGSPLPSAIGMSGLFATGTRFASTRLTEGFASAFQPRDATSDAGTRFLARYSGFPAGARVFVPDFVAGSSAAQPTAGGDLGGLQSAGRYTIGSGTLLLARVIGADASGAGGFPARLPASSSTVTLDAASEVALSGGAGSVVYEVVDSNSSLLESAQFPAFIGLPASSAPGLATEDISLAPVAGGAAASSTAPVPRFAAVAPGSDCGILGDCDAAYFPRFVVVVTPQPMQFTAIAGGAAFEQPGYIAVQNQGGGTLVWTATVRYQTGAGWLVLEQSTNINWGSVRVFAKPQNLAPGVYAATVVIDAGPLYSTSSVPVTLTVRALPVLPPPPTPPTPPTPPPTPPTPPPAPVVSITAVRNAASLLEAPVVPGSLSTLDGVNLAGTRVSVTFDELPATLLFAGARQINVLVPEGLAGRASAMMTVTVDGASSTPRYVSVAAAWPAIFDGGVLNQDSAPNGVRAPAAPGSVIQIFVTGLAAGGRGITAKVHDREGLVPLYAGPAPGLPGVQQVNVVIPADLPAMPSTVSVCAPGGAAPLCSLGAPLVIGR